MPFQALRLGRMLVTFTVTALLCSACFDLGLGLNDGAANDRMPSDRQDQPADGGTGDDEAAPGGDGGATEEATGPTDAVDDGGAAEDPDGVDEPAQAPVPPSPDGSDLASAHYGPTGASCPADAVRVGAGQSVQQAIDASGRDATICVTEGTYRLDAPLSPEPGNELVFERGAVLNGSRRITNWTRDGGHWVASGQRQSFESSSTPCTDNPAACESEDLFVDDEPLTRVLDRSDLRSGTFYFDEDADRLYIADDPTGHKLEAPVVETAIEAPGAHDIIVRGATIEKFAKHGIVTSDGWLVVDNEIRYVHSHGLRVFGSTRVEGNYIHHTGKMGIFADEGDGLVFEGNQLAHNNYLGFDRWHAGATKITGSTGTVVRNNWSHHNTGDGWWFDWDNAATVVEGNLFEHNSHFGFFYETSFDAHIRDNIFRRNGSPSERSGAGLWITTSKNVEVSHNTFDDNYARTLAFVSTDRGTSDRYGEREMSDLFVHDNTFAMSEGYVGVPYGSSDVYQASSGNRFVDNDYVVPDRDRDWWRWGTPGDGHTGYDWAEWNAAGQDRNGTITVDS